MKPLETQSVTLHEAMRIALGYHTAGEIEKAERIYRQVIGADPQHADALGLLALVLVQTGRGADAEPLLADAIRLAPRSPVHRNTLGTLRRAQGQHGAAVAACRDAVALAPSLADAHVGLALSLRDSGAVAEARA